MYEVIETWLKNSIAGIILLGAFGSLLAILLAHFGNALSQKVLPAPFRLHRMRQGKQAYFLGYSAAIIDNDSTGRNLITFLCFHMCLFVIALTVFVLCAIFFSLLIVAQSPIILTLGSFSIVAVGFTALYVAYFQFEYLHRMYLTYWKVPMKNAAQHFDADVIQGRADTASDGPERPSPYEKTSNDHPRQRSAHSSKEEPPPSRQ